MSYMILYGQEDRRPLSAGLEGSPWPIRSTRPPASSRRPPSPLANCCPATLSPPTPTLTPHPPLPPPRSYKPQKISPKFDGSVRTLLHKKIRDAYLHPQV
jgi:hypothetical protein